MLDLLEPFYLVWRHEIFPGRIGLPETENRMMVIQYLDFFDLIGSRQAVMDVNVLRLSMVAP